MTAVARPIRTAPMFLALASLAIARAAVEGQVGWQNDIRLTYEYDDNVREEIADAVHARVARVAVKSDLVLDDSTSNHVSFVYKGGFKRYFDVTLDSLEITSQFIHEGQASYTRRFEAAQLELSGGIKHRYWQDDTFFFVNEDGFTRLWGGVSARRAFSPSFSGEVAARVSSIAFKHVDEVFGNESKSGRLRLAKRISDEVMADLSYGIEQRVYDGRGKLRDPEDDPANIFAPERPRQVDTAHEGGIGIAFLEPFGFQGRYRYHVNDSNSFGFSYRSHIFNIQLAQQLPWRMIVQFYGGIELRKFHDPVRGLVGAIDVEDTDNNVMVFSLLKEMNGHLDLEARYGRYRNESINLNAFYTKNVYSLGFRVRP